MNTNELYSHLMSMTPEDVFELDVEDVFSDILDMRTIDRERPLGLLVSRFKYAEALLNIDLTNLEARTYFKHFDKSKTKTEIDREVDRDPVVTDKRKHQSKLKYLAAVCDQLKVEVNYAVRLAETEMKVKEKEQNNDRH